MIKWKWVILMQDKSKTIIINQSGDMKYIGNISDINKHINDLIDYIGDNYSEVEELSKIDEKTPRDMVAYHLINLGNVVYLDAGYYGVIFVPNSLTDKQVEEVYNLADDLKDEPVMLNHSPNIDFGFPMFVSIGINGDISLKQAMDEYMDLEKNKGNKK